MSPANDNNEEENEETYRVVVESERDGTEYRGWSGIKRSRIEAVSEAIQARAVDFIAVGKLPPQRTTLRPLNFGRGRGRK